MKRSNESPIVSIIINAHNEGILLHRTLKSLNKNIEEAAKEGISTEVIIVADKVDEKTLDYIKTRSQAALTAVKPKLEIVEYGDLGLSRNHGIDKASGEFIGNLDADDLWSDNWITKAVVTLRKNKNVIVHHAIVLNFGTKNGVWHVKSSTDPSFDPRSMIEDNWWASSMMTHRSTFEKVKYQKTRRDRQFSFEDWLFNCETLAAGIEHIAVPETTMFYRRKPVSMMTAHVTGLPSPNKLFTLAGQKEYLKKHKTTQAVENMSGQIKAEVAVPSRDTTSTRKVVVKSIKYGGRVGVRLGKRYAKPYLDSHHRLKTYLKSVKEATHTLIAEPNVNVVEGRKNIPGWLRDHWYKANEFDPHLFPTHYRITTAYSRAMMTMGPEQKAYWELAEMLGEELDYVLVMPYVRRAGAYMVGVHYVKAYKELHPGAKVAILTTEKTYSSVKEMVPEGIKLVEAPDSFYALSDNLKERVLAKLFVNLQPKYVHALHSQEGFRALKRYPAQISFKSKILLSTFNYDYTAEGQKMNALVAFGEDILPYVTKVFTDNEWVAEDTVSIYGIDKALVSAHAMPIQSSDKKSDGINLRGIDGKMRVLWAARMAKQKRPDILLAIAEECHKKKLPYEFIVYGEIYDKIITQRMLDKLSKLPNVQYRGAFHKGIQALPTGEFEVYLSTSEAEGTPNAILEAQERSLIVVAPKLGGIPEAVKDKKTGMLVDDFDSVDQYLAALDYIYKDERRAQSIAHAARKSVETGRSWTAFVDQVKKDL